MCDTLPALVQIVNRTGEIVPESAHRTWANARQHAMSYSMDERAACLFVSEPADPDAECFRCGDPAEGGITTTEFRRGRSTAMTLCEECST